MFFPVYHFTFNGVDATDTMSRIYGQITNPEFLGAGCGRLNFVFTFLVIQFHSVPYIPVWGVNFGTLDEGTAHEAG
jgi:hypothetical protein